MTVRRRQPFDRGTSGSRGEANIWVVLLIALVLVALLVAFGISRTSKAKRAAAVTTTSTTYIAVSPRSTVVSSTTIPTSTTVPPPIQQVVAALGGALPQTLPPTFTPSGTSATLWVRNESIGAVASKHGIVQSTCIPTPTAIGQSTRSWISGFVGSATYKFVRLSLQRFASPELATAWVAAHGNGNFTLCNQIVDRSANTSRFQAIVGTDGITAIAGVGDGKADHYTAALSFAQPCQLFNDTYWNAIGQNVLTADFATCSPPFPPAEMQQLVRGTIATVKKTSGV